VVRSTNAGPLPRLSWSNSYVSARVAPFETCLLCRVSSIILLQVDAKKDELTIPKDMQSERSANVETESLSPVSVNGAPPSYPRV
jgi:hypothetical protein